MTKTSLAKNTILISAGMIIQKALMFVMLPFFSAWVSVDEFGIYDLCLSYASLCIPILTLSVADAVFRYSMESDLLKQKQPFVTNGLLINIAGMVVLAVAFAAAFPYVDKNLLVPLALLAASEILNTHMQGFLRGIKRLDLFGISALVSTVSMAGLTTLFILRFGMGADGLLLGYACGYFIGITFSVVSTGYWRYVSFHTISTGTLRKMLVFSLPLILNNVSWWIVNVSDRTIISLFLGTAQNGIYAIANKISAVCIAVYGMFHIAWNQTASEMIDSGHGGEYFSDIFNKIFRILASLIGGLLACNFILFGFVFDERYAGAAFHAPILLLAVMFHSLGHFIGGIQIAQKNTRANGFTTFAGAVSNVVIHLALIKYIGLYAASISTFLSGAVMFISKNLILKKTISLRLIKNSWWLIFYCAYIFAMQYINVPLPVHAANLLLACVVFFIVNKDMAFKFIAKTKNVIVKKS